MRALPVVLALLLSACAGQTFIDGYPVGDRVETRSQFVNFAMTTFDQSSPGHASVATTEMFAPDYRSKTGERILLSRSGGNGDFVVVFHLNDGSLKAFSVGCGVGVAVDTCYLRPREIVPD